MKTLLKCCFSLLAILSVLLTTGCATSRVATDLSNVKKQREELAVLTREIEIVMRVFEALETEVASGKKSSKLPYDIKAQSIELERVNRKLLKMRLQLQKLEKEFRQRYQIQRDEF